jgi:hypothetical protein
MDFLDLMQWLTPVIGGVVGWLASRINRRMDSQKQLLDTLERQSNDIAELYQKMGFVLRAIEKRNVCRYFSICPVDAELQRTQKDHQRKAGIDGQCEGEDCEEDGDSDRSLFPYRPPPVPV